jgi:O-antigen/teichoic acid export membrane protein
LISVITNSVSDGWLPWFHDALYENRRDEIRKNVKWIVGLGCYVGLACISLTPEAVQVLGGSRYLAGTTCVSPVVLGVICQYIYTHYVNIEMHLKKTKYVSMGTIMAALLNIVLNAIFIPRFGYVAASYTTLASYFVLMLIHFFITKKILKIKLYNDAFMFGSLAATTAISFGIVKTFEYRAIRYFIILLGFGSFIYIYRGFILKNIYKFKKKCTKL